MFKQHDEIIDICQRLILGYYGVGKNNPYIPPDLWVINVEEDKFTNYLNIKFGEYYKKRYPCIFNCPEFGLLSYNNCDPYDIGVYFKYMDLVTIIGGIEEESISIEDY